MVGQVDPRQSGSFFHGLQRSSALNRVAGHALVSIAPGVDETELPWVHVQFLGDLVHLHLHPELTVHDGEATHRAGASLVGEDRLRFDADVGNVVGSRGKHTALLRAVGGEATVGAGIVPFLDQVCHQGSVLLDAGLIFEDEDAALGRILEILAAGHAVLDRLMELECGHASDVVRVDVVLPTEAAAHGAADVADLAHRQIEYRS